MATLTIHCAQLRKVRDPAIPAYSNSESPSDKPVPRSSQSSVFFVFFVCQLHCFFLKEHESFECQLNFTYIFLYFQSFEAPTKNKPTVGSSVKVDSEKTKNKHHTYDQKGKHVFLMSCTYFLPLVMLAVPTCSITGFWKVKAGQASSGWALPLWALKVAPQP